MSVQKSKKKAMTPQEFKKIAKRIAKLANKLHNTKDFMHEFVNVQISFCKCESKKATHYIYVAEIYAYLKNNGEKTEIRSNCCDSVEDAMKELEKNLKEDIKAKR